MNLKRTSKITAHALAGALLYAALGGIHPGFASQAGARDGKPSPAIGTIRVASSERLESLSPDGSWTCPMHPEIHNHEPGKCPICKMKLIKTKPKNV